MFKWLKTHLFGEPESTGVQDAPKWMETASEHSNWNSGILSEGMGSLYWLRRASQTAPEYDAPLLSIEQKANIRHDRIVALRHSFEHSYTINEDVRVVVSSLPKECVLRIGIEIDEFEKWASTSRLYQFSGDDFHSLGLTGTFYRDLISELSETIGAASLDQLENYNGPLNRHPMVFEPVESRSEYQYSFHINKKSIADMI